MEANQPSSMAGAKHYGKLKDQPATNCEWPRMFVITSWWLWRWRNGRVFISESVETHRKIAQIREAEKEISRAFLREASVRRSSQSEKFITVCWKPSSYHTSIYPTLNVDGSVKATTRKAVMGGILRCAEGVCRGGFASTSDQADLTIIEVRAIVKATEWPGLGKKTS